MYNTTSTETQQQLFRFISNFSNDVIYINLPSDRKTLIKFSSTNSVTSIAPDGYERDHLEILMKYNTSNVIIYYKLSNLAAG